LSGKVQIRISGGKIVTHYNKVEAASTAQSALRGLESLECEIVDVREEEA